MQGAPSAPHHHENAFRGFDRSVERVLGADMRLVYGMGAPILLVVGLIVLMALQPAVWLVASVLVLELAFVVIVIYGFVAMLNDEEDDDTTLP